jgi:hypothetical protein
MSRDRMNRAANSILRYERQALHIRRDIIGRLTGNDEITLSQHRETLKEGRRQFIILELKNEKNIVRQYFHGIGYKTWKDIKEDKTGKRGKFKYGPYPSLHYRSSSQSRKIPLSPLLQRLTK